MLDEIGGNGKRDAAERQEALIAVVTSKWSRGFATCIAAASAATVQQAGIALGAAIAGLVANASGLNNGLDPGSMLPASVWIPLALIAAPLGAGGIGVRLNLMVPCSFEQGLTAAGRD